MEPNVDTLVAIARMRDPLGVLSIYVDADPCARTGERPAWDIAIKNELEALRQRIVSEAPHDQRTVILTRLAELEPEVLWLLDPKTTGRGRALWATIADGSVERLSMQMPFPNRVTLSPTAHIRPLLTALDDAQPAGVALVSRAGVRLVEWQPGHIEELGNWQFVPETQEWRMMKYVSGSARTQVTTTLTDKLKRRLDVQRRRFFAPVAEAVDEVARQRQWERLLLTGDPRLTEEFAKALPAGNSRRGVLFSSRLLHDLEGSALSEAVAGELAAAKREAQLALVTRARDAALAGGPGALGLADTLAALTEGRVHRLLLDGAREWQGAVAPDGRLLAPGEQPPDIPPDRIVPEPFLAERMIERALSTSAFVTPLEGEAAAALAEADGVAAILRW